MTGKKIERGAEPKKPFGAMRGQLKGESYLTDELLDEKSLGRKQTTEQLLKLRDQGSPVAMDEIVSTLRTHRDRHEPE